jgi:hypothetical protein
MLFLCLASERRRDEYALSGEVGKEHSSRCSSVCSLQLPFLHFLLHLFAALIIGGVKFFTFRHPIVSARWGGTFIPFLEALLVQVTATAPQSAGKLLAVCPDVAELLAVMSLSKTILSSICLHPDCDMAEALKSEHFFGFCRPRQGY